MAVVALASARGPRGLVLSADDGVDVAARAVVRFHLRGFTREAAGARAGEVEPVHQLRVATRRLRATMRLFEPVVPSAFRRAVTDDLEWIAGTIGAVRDLDVLRDQLVDARARLERDLARALGPLDLELGRARALAHRELVAALESPRCRRLLDRLTGFAQSATPARPRRLGDLALGLTDPLVRTVLRRGRRAAAERAPVPLHRLRVAVKRLRYALETLEGLGGDHTRKVRRRLVCLQEVLGRYQDTVTGRAWLRRYAESAERLPRPTLMALGALIDVLARRSRKADRRFPRAWERLDRRKLRAGVRDELARARGRVETRARVAAS